MSLIVLDKSKSKGKDLSRRAATAVILRPKRPTRPSKQPNKSTQCMMDYVRTMEDPWENPPIKLGYGCFTETVLGTGFQRTAFNVNDDGSFAAVLLPSSTGSLYTNNSGAGGTTWANASLANTGALQDQGAEARVVSGGIRLFALYPGLSAPGVLFAGVIGSVTTNVLTTYSPNYLNGLSSSHLGIGSRGARACLLPQDNSSFDFKQSTLTGIPTAELVTSSIPYISGNGFPSGTKIWIEAILNLEMIPKSTGSTIGLDPTSSEPASSYFATAQNLFDSARSIMGSTVVMDAVEGLSSIYSPAAGRLVRGARSAFGQGSHYTRVSHAHRPQLVAGSSSSHQSHESSVVIEEMKEEAADH